MNLQPVFAIGVSYLYVPVVSFDENLYTSGGDIILRFSKEKCQVKVVSATTSECYDFIKIRTDIESCFEQTGRWSVQALTNEVKKEDRELIGWFDVVVYDHKILK